MDKKKRVGWHCCRAAKGSWIQRTDYFCVCAWVGFLQELWFLQGWVGGGGWGVRLHLNAHDEKFKPSQSTPVKSILLEENV